MSAESQIMAAKLGLRMATFVVSPMEVMAPQLHKYREVFEVTHGMPAPPPMVCDMITIHEDEEEAENKIFGFQRRHIVITEVFDGP